jgi:hypothetical protein
MALPLTISDCRNLLDDPTATDEQIAQAREQCDRIAEVVLLVDAAWAREQLTLVDLVNTLEDARR